jgi:phosphate butyryltransferase
MKNFSDLMAKALQCPPKKIAVVAAHEREVLESIKEAHAMGLAQGVLFGDALKIQKRSEEIGMHLPNHEVIDRPDDVEATREAVTFIREGKADILMKGKITTPVILREVLSRERGLRNGHMMSHVALFEVPGYNRLFIMSDSGLNIMPNLEQKIGMVKNATEVAHRLGIAQPKVAIVAGNESVNPEMPSSIDAALIAKMAERGQIRGCIIDGPLSLDLAVSEEAARAKAVDSEVAGHADILIMPNIDAANTLYKAVSFLFRAPINGVIVGGKAPIIITSRADLASAKLNSIALCVILTSSSGQEDA